MPKRKPHVNKSQAIREFIEQHPDAKPKEILDTLTEKGIEVSLALVNSVKYKATRQSNGHYKELLTLSKIVDELGGIEKTKEALDVLSKLK